MLDIVLYVALGLIALVFVLAAFRSQTFSVTRSTRIHAPASRVFPHVDGFHAWRAWSPYEKLDPALERTYGGAERGRGATYAWSGNDKAGAGRMEIVASQPSSRIQIQLDFTRPFRAANLVEFTLVESDGGTDVTWAMSGACPHVMRVVAVFRSLDDLVGKDFAAGLAQSKALVERGAKA